MTVSMGQQDKLIAERIIKVANTDSRDLAVVRDNNHTPGKWTIFSIATRPFSLRCRSRCCAAMDAPERLINGFAGLVVAQSWGAILFVGAEVRLLRVAAAKRPASVNNLNWRVCLLLSLSLLARGGLTLTLNKNYTYTKKATFSMEILCTKYNISI